jgi:hypothetical protein
MLSMQGRCFKTVVNKSPREISSDNGVRVQNFATSNCVLIKRITFPHHNIHKYTFTTSEGKTPNQMDHVLINRLQHFSILYVRSLRGADCDTGCYF